MAKTISIARMTSAQFLNHARQLRTESAQAEARFMIFLVEGEQHPRIWEGTGYTYLQFLVHNNLCAEERYRSCKSMLDMYGVQTVLSIGFEAVIVAGKLKDKPARDKLIDHVRTFEQTNQTVISERSARDAARDLKLVTAVHRKGADSVLGASERNDRLTALVAQLQATNAALREENNALRAENRTLKQQLKKTTVKPKRAAARATA